MKTLRHLLILVIIEIFLCGLWLLELSTAAEFITAAMLPTAIQMMAFFVGMLCLILFADGIVYMHRMNKALGLSVKSQPIYEYPPMLDAMDMIDNEPLVASNRPYAVTLESTHRAA